MNIKNYSKDELNDILSVKGNSLYSDAFKRLLKNKASLISLIILLNIHVFVPLIGIED